MKLCSRIALVPADADVFDLAEVTDGDAIEEELINLLQSSVVTLWNAEVGEDTGQDGGGAEYEANLRPESRVWLVEKIWD